VASVDGRQHQLSLYQRKLIQSQAWTQQLFIYSIHTSTSERQSSVSLGNYIRRIFNYTLSKKVDSVQRYVLLLTK
jgi:hypothetical protein